MIVPVKKVSLVTITDNESLMLEEIGKVGAIQFRKLDEAEFIGFEDIVVEEKRVYESLLERYRILYGKLGIAKILSPEEQKNIIKEQATVEELTKEIEVFEKRAADIEGGLKEGRDWLEELNKAEPVLLTLKNQGIDPKDLGEFKHIFSRAGNMSIKFLPRLERILGGRKDVTYKASNISETEAFLHVSGLVEVKPWIDKALSAISFNEFELPEKVPGKVDQAIRWTKEESRNVGKKIQELERNWDDLRQDFSKKSGILEAKINYSLSLSSAKSNSLRSKMMSAFQGWVPVDKVSDLDAYLEDVRQKTHGQLMVWYDDPSPDEEVPTIMKNPKLFRAYEVLTRQYGYPDSRELDPTPISTFLWVIMFGIMFPDYGQGLVIIGLGILFAFIMKKEMMGMNFVKIGQLMIGLGISAIFFGLLTGSFFLIEVDPLWPGLTNPWILYSNNVLWIIKLAIFFGITQIILGIVISIYNHIKVGEYHDALLGEHGVAGLVTFIGIVLLAFLFLGINIAPGISFPELGMGVFKHWAIIILIAGILTIFIKPVIAGEGLTMGFGVLLETSISFFANMLSYSRIAGFAIAHAALALVVAELLHANPALGIGLGLIFLNFFALSIELLVSMIQALRLLYYEFSTKFFKGTGSPYAPFRL